MTEARPEPFHAPAPAVRRSLKPFLALACALAMLPIASAIALSAPEPALAPATVDAKLLERIQAAPGETLDAFVTLDHETTEADVAALAALGMTVLQVFPEFQLAYGLAYGSDLLAIAAAPGVLHVHGNDELQLHGETATVATRAREAWDAKSTSLTPIAAPGGGVVDGTGVTIAVIDSGIDGTHPDLAPAMVGNFKYVCSSPGLINTVSQTCFGNALLFGTTCPGHNQGWVSLADTDSSSGHGTHVAGIAAGRGIASDGRFMGAAPDANLIGLGSGEVISILFAVEAFKWVSCNGAAFGVDIVQNSWGSAGAFVATDPVNMAVTALVGAGYTVVFSAGNDGPGGTVNRYARNPALGVISVGSTYDGDSAANAAATIAPTTSQCLATSPAVDCPDVAAPGELITAALAKTGPVVAALSLGPHLAYAPYYGTISGTSMAAPHVSGIIALMIEANGAPLAPAAVEDILEDTAVPIAAGAPYAIANPTNPAPSPSVSTSMGAGHVDAIAAIEAVTGAAPLGSPLPQVSQNPHVYVGGADLQVASGVQWTVPAGQALELSERFMVSGDAGWPLAATQACQFVVFPGAYPTAGAGVVVPCATGGLQLIASSGELTMDAPYAFTGVGDYTVESQVLWGGVFTAFDHFVVRVV